jgi:RNA polymerase sigma-70 factor (ECF subfamily)
MASAKRRALDVLRRERTARRFAPELARPAEGESAIEPTLAEVFEPGAIRDEQLRMMFACCQPKLSGEAQVALVLNILCGFGVGEIAEAFVCGRAAVEKRLSRGKKVLAGSKRLFDVAALDDFPARLSAVQRAIYLLFNEGYHGSSPESAVRAELCQEAMRLGAMLRGHPPASTPATHALGALMCFHAARLPARTDAAGDLSTLFEQDRLRWDPRLLAEGHELLDLSATGDDLTEYHIEAAIAAVHATAPRPEETNWRMIVELYDKLLHRRDSPVVALNRAIAVSQWKGPQRGLEEIRKIDDRQRLQGYVFYWAALGEMELRSGRSQIAGGHFRTAMDLARNDLERRFLKKRTAACCRNK